MSDIIPNNQYSKIEAEDQKSKTEKTQTESEAKPLENDAYIMDSEPNPKAPLSTVFGGLSFLCTTCCCFCLGFVAPIIAVILAIIALVCQKGKYGTDRMLNLILAITSLVLSGSFLVLMIILFFTGFYGSFLAQFLDNLGYLDQFLPPKQDSF